MVAVLVGVVSIIATLCPFPTQGVVAPVTGRIVERYVEPSCDRCAGRRGVTVAVADGAVVRATGAGRVSFAGPVGGALWVVQEVAPGVRVTYGRLATIADGLSTGADLEAGRPLGTAHERVYLGVRVGETPRDPLLCWARRPRLVEPNVGRSVRRR